MIPELHLAIDSVVPWDL